jgi:glucan phosphoethanolaminetransferase (alkaline phosphatase superfamily)
MTANVSPQTGKSSKLWKQVFMVFILIQAVGELAIGFTLLFNLPMAMENFNTPYSPDMEVLGLTLGLYLFLLTTLMVLSFVWIKNANPAGATLGIIIGLFLMSFGVGMLIKFGETQALWVDGFRGGLTAVLAYMAGKSFKPNKAA